MSPTSIGNKSDLQLKQDVEAELRWEPNGVPPQCLA
jgi:hypothetical protein